MLLGRILKNKPYVSRLKPGKGALTERQMRPRFDKTRRLSLGIQDIVDAAEGRVAFAHSCKRVPAADFNSRP